ncbi:MAG: hypothetical protein BGN88_08535 [Clostridiales bacterium 43-6]|nr:MAG: hypothetical protein BGN88_08535 [Clostridiales bacterium 43-6]
MGKYGYFNDKDKEYVITDNYPPLPWINFLNNDNFTAIISQSAGGAAFYREASTGRITKYNQTRAIPIDRPGYYLYFREEDGSVWAPTYEPVRTSLDSYQCRHGLGYTQFESEYKGIAANVTYFVPRNDNVLLWKVQLTNHREKDVTLKSFSFVEFSFLLAHREPIYWQWCRFYTTTLFNQDMNAVTYDCHVYEDQPKLKVFLSSSEPVTGFDCDRNAFLGRAGTLDLPDAVKNGGLTNKELPGGGFPIGAIQNDITIKAGETVSFTISLGCGLDWETDAEMIKKYQDINTVHAELEAVKEYWSNTIEVFQAEVPDKDIERMINIWNPYNCIVGFNRKMSMTGMTTGMEKGGVQSRDSSQDSMSLVSLRTDLAKERMELIFHFQMPSGEFYSSFDGDIRKPSDFYAVRSDNGVWPVFTTYALVSETGDYDFLKKQIPYYEGENVSILTHMAQGLKHIYGRRGRNNLPLIIDIDWNDNLYIFKEDGNEESVMLAQQLVYACRLLKEMADICGDTDIIQSCDEIIDAMIIALNGEGVWDGDWYKRYIFASDKPALGSKDRREGKIFLNTQSWAVISESTGTKERAVHCMDKAAEMLGTKYGLKLSYPAFTGIPEPEDPLYNNGPGVRENGGIFHHAHTWAVMAETFLRRGDKAYQYYRQILPNVASEERGADLYINEPYAFSSTTLIDPDPRAGEGDMAWFSGTVTWMYLVGTQYILGVRPVLKGLLIDPCICSEWDGYKVSRRYKGTMYHITFKNPEHVSTGVKTITVDGTLMEGTVLPHTDAKEVNVEVVMG